MTSVTQLNGRHEALFIADFHPRLGAYLARQHANGYDAAAGRTRFLLWLATHADGRDVLTDYLAKANRIPPLTAVQEAELANRIQAGHRAEEQLAEGGGALAGAARASLERAALDGAQASNRLQEASLRLVLSMAGRYTGRGVPLQDLIQEGNLGLIRAVQKYDPARGYRFAAFATWWIRQALTRAVAGQAGRVPVARPADQDSDPLIRTGRRLEQALGREPTPEELAAELDLSYPGSDETGEEQP